MAGGAQKRLADDRVSALVQCLTQIAAKLSSPPPADFAKLFDSMACLQQGKRPQHIANPPAFHRMCRFMRQSGSPTMGELSEAISVPLSTATRMAHWLADNGLAERTSDPNDRRIVRIALTDTGRAFLDAVERHMEEKAGKILDCLTGEEQAILLTIFEKVAKVLPQGES
jgi:DNA-binding MarR family transcriptional regulator